MDNLHLTACLILYQQRQDQALGIGWTSAKVQGLLWYYGKQRQKQLGRLAAAAYLKGVIDQGSTEISMLVKRAEKAKDKHKIAQRVIERQKIVEAAYQNLQALIGSETSGSIGKVDIESSRNT